MAAIEIGFIGLGEMGRPMAKNLIKAGFQLTVYDIRKETMEELEKLGAKPAGSAKEVAAASEVIISMVRDTPSTEQVVFGKDGLWEGIREGSTIIITSMTTCLLMPTAEIAAGPSQLTMYISAKPTAT